jgi:hypothetical protein
MKEPPLIVGARESPELYAIGAKPDFDALGGKTGEIGAGLDANAGEKRDEVVGWREDGDRVGCEEVAVRAGTDDERRSEVLGPRS